MATNTLLAERSNTALPSTDGQIIYPDSDGQPMADNTKQFRWIVAVAGGLAALFADNPDVFVAGDLLWYPVEGDPKIRIAPDALVVFGRPKGDRGSYRQWQEAGIAPQVVFEILSPGNTVIEMSRKFRFYERYGVEEYYIYDPDNGALEGWRRPNSRLQLIDDLNGWISPRLGIRFQLEDGELRIYRPDGRRFQTYEELEAERAATQQRAERESQRAERESQRAERESQRAERLAAQLRALGMKPEDE